MKRKLLAAVLISIGNLAFSQTSFRIQIDSLNMDNYNVHPYATKCADGGTAIAGSMIMGSFAEMAFIIKTDLNGNIEWSKAFDIGYLEPSIWDVTIIPTSDSGFYFEYEPLDGMFAQYEVPVILKLDKFGNTQVVKHGLTQYFGNSLWFFELEKNTNNLYIIGERYTKDGILQEPCCWAPFIAKLDTALNPLFIKQFGANLTPRSIKVIYNGGVPVSLLVAGIDIGAASLTKLDLTGNIIWQKKYSSFGNYNIYLQNILQNDSIFYIIERIPNNNSSAIRKIDFFGNTISYDFIDTTAADIFLEHLEISSNGNLLMTGSYTDSLFSGPLIVESDLNLNILQAKVGIDSNYAFSSYYTTLVHIDTIDQSFLFTRNLIVAPSATSFEFEKQNINNTTCNFIPVNFNFLPGVGQDTVFSSTIYSIPSNMDPITINDFTLAPVAAPLCTSTGISYNTQLQNQLSIYPNPANEFVVISSEFGTCDEIRITDVLGKTIVTKIFSVPAVSCQLSTANFSNGMYFLSVETEKDFIVKKVVVQH